ncbi:MAG: phosphatase PAP2 family protein [Candidatus Omnitrophica bacterium]|nr:phosphatase PAP2 family protein [Candidatus Omnitrophota bacterium]
MSFYNGSRKEPQGFRESVNAALEGIVHTLKQERNMRIHFLAGFLVLVLGVYLGLSAVEFMFLLFAVSFVLVAELFNTAIEIVFDFIYEEFHPKIKIVKDVSAGAVFVASINAALTGYLLFVKRVRWSSWQIGARLKQAPWHITFISLLTVVGIVLLIKILRKEKDLLRGGMPSGHSAVAFAAWVIVSLIVSNALVSLLVFLLALLVARSRVVSGPHTVWEAAAGALIGALVSLLVYQLLI